MAEYEYVKRKLNDKLFNTSEVAVQTSIARTTLLKIKRGEKVKPYIIVALNDYFKKAGD